MHTPDTATPAIENDEPAFDVEQLGGPLGNAHTAPTAIVQDVRCDLVGNDIAIVGDVEARGALDMCRRLVADGVDRNASLKCYRDGRLALRVKSIGAGAKLTVRETAADGPRVVAWKAFPRRAVTAPVGSNQEAVYPPSSQASPLRESP